MPVLTLTGISARFAEQQFPYPAQKGSREEHVNTRRHMNEKFKNSSC